MDRVQGTTAKPGLDLIARYSSNQKLPTSNDSVLSLSQFCDHQISDQRRIRVTLGAYIAPNVAQIQLWRSLGLHIPNAAGSRRAGGALNRAFLQRKRGSSPPVPPLALIP
jgi:hypothetical protein